ncbi:MAG: hypothetical protein C0631_16485 [Sedimenticola sp.]|nr:MAG: hypothetical protein C0631_16485 [Sedimenticola sp.]
MPTKILKISEAALVEPGFSTKGAVVDQPEGTHQVIMGKHLTAGEPYHYEDSHRLRIVPHRKVEKYLLNPGDILFTAKGALNNPVILERLPEKTLAPSTFFILKPRKNIDPYYLFWCICQPPFQAQINEIRTQSVSPMVPRKQFDELTIPIPDFETQKKIAHLGKLQQRERELRGELLAETERLQSALGSKIINSLVESK